MNMRRTKKMLLAVMVVVLGLIGTSSPVAAGAIGIVVNVVDLHVPCGLGLPAISPPSSCAVAMTERTCVDLFFGKKFTVGICSISGAGTITGVCGQASGWMWGSITTSNGTGFTYHFHFTIAGSVMVATGTVTKTGQDGFITVEGGVSPVPSIGGGSCSSGTQTQFVMPSEFAIATTDPL